MRRFALHTKRATAGERAVAKVLQDKWGWKCTATARFACYDLTARRRDGTLAAIIEVKCRDFAWGTHATVHVSLNKLLRCLDQAGRLGCNFCFLVKARDGIYQMWLTRAGLRLLPRKVGGRADRPGIKTDIETLVDIPIGHFLKLNEPWPNPPVDKPTL